jgi:KDEL-tailed cysteine endopeptidase
VNQAPTGTAFLATPFTEAEREFINFVSQYHRSYGTKEEYEYRLKIFTETYNDIISHNTQNDATFTKGINQFSDMSDYEFKQMLGYKRSLRQADKVPNTVILSEVDLPASVDWRTQNAVTPVKNQGSCGSCWAFSTTGSVEGVNAINSGTLVSLSEQQLVDCSMSYGNLGCNGGLMDNAFKYTEDYELETEAAYPYKGVRSSCSYSAAKGQVGTKSYVDVKTNTPSQLQAAVAQQPVSVAIEADKLVFQSYTGGVITGTSCGTNLDHGVLVIGYGTDPKYGDYWLLKNSWGTSWGESGYFRLGRSSTAGAGVCGLQEEPSYPTE